jgi:deoxyribodipyrimidine photo-lyase
MIYKIFPRVATGPFLDAGQKIRWQNDRSSFEAWCEGRTGYPFVDAAMRQLNTEGWMHNRLRMIAASFLSKLLLIDWRLGEAYFERHLMDADPAQNNGGWQWAASTGTDAAPYFRIFNPAAQSKQFDAAGAFVKRYIPELGTAAYPDPIVDYGFARARALASYTAAFKGLER